MNNDDGCSYGKVNRQCINDMKSDIEEIKKKVDRPPIWATAIISILSGFVGLLGGIILK